MVPTVRRWSHRLNRCGKARKANNGEHVRHGAVGGRHYSQQSQSDRHTHCAGVGNIRWQCSFHHPSPTELFKLCSRWVPYLLTSEHKGARFAAFLEFLQRYSAEGNDFLSRMVTGDETWDTGTKQASMAWRQTSSPVRTKYKVSPISG
ncbi:hypothetical protein AVEN_145676-1 [Araneus ventricosus]|uniref:Uncharacterized protein n=1 Tax=Araneus ventricosus TaxID=182803 RepID=A0A4Y2JUW6_ARAVE|nr:hypothetical protein AVEN_145676-1 [Araneus ventricosus]